MVDAGIDIQSLTQRSVAALQAGDGRQARSLLETITASGRADSSHWLGLAYACSQLGDTSAALAAVDRSLELDPRNLRAVIVKADCLERQAKPGQSLEVYRYALRLAASATNLPEDIRQGLARAKNACDRREGEYHAFLTERLKTAGFSPASCSRRFQQSLDLIFGGKQIYYQQPRRYYYPGLPQIQFYEPGQFDWVASVQEETAAIRAELTAVLNDSARFSPYVKADDTHLPRDNKGLENSEKWSALFLWDYGRLVAENAALFPRTLAALELAPLPRIAGQAPMALFSKLSADTRIPPHNGLLNTRLICHLPLIVPENCGALRVGNEERPWVEGELLIFDDSIEHEAWNASQKERVILLFEIWRPEIDDDDRELISAILRAVKEFNEQTA
jgi:aspartyl/asparaginyl beta-hydroxylase (cupin superfamily)